MKLGVIARADSRGLAHQTWEVARNLNPERVLVLTVPSSEGQGFQPHFDRFPNAQRLTVDDRVATWRLNEAKVREWLDGLDVVYTAETFYDDQLPDWAASMGVATVCHANPEWYRHHRGGIPHPTQWWAATDWRLNYLPDSTRVVPMPVPLDRFTFTPSDERAVIHPAGRVAAGDRNGTDLVCQAAEHMPDVTVYISAQSGLRRLPNLPNVVQVDPCDDYWDTYRRAPVMLLPRRYGGLCLPVIEACGAGIIPVLPSCPPNRTWPAVHVKAAKSRQRMKSQGGDLALYDTDPQELAAATVDALDRQTELAPRVRAWARDNSWDALAPVWLDELARIADTKPAARRAVKPVAKPGAAVSVLVPYTQDRADLWRWVKHRYAALHPDWEIVDVECVGTWCKGATLAQAADWASGDVFVIADADSYVDPDTLRDAVDALDGHRWVVPHGDVYRLNERATRRLLECDPDEVYDHRNGGVERAVYRGPAGGGFVVCGRDVWDELPMDSRFYGYGGEDIAWGMALETLVGPFHRVGGDLVHLWHPALGNRAKSAATLELLAAYKSAYLMPRKMRAVVNATDMDEVVPLERPARFVCDNRRLRIKVGPGRYIQFREGIYETTDPDLADVLRRSDRVEEVA